MCHQLDGRPPAAPDSCGEVREHGPVEVAAADGARFRAYRALPVKSNGRSCILLPDVRGLVPFYEDLAQRFAEAGFTAIAIDYFGRTRGTHRSDASFDWRQHLPMVRTEHVRTDAAAVAELLRRDNSGPMFTVGFCFGGGHSWRLGASEPWLAGTIGFYGLPYLVKDVVNSLCTPMLLLLAGEDAETPQEEYNNLIAQLDTAGKEYEVHVYDRAPHSFFDRSFADNQETCADAWRRIRRFTGTS